MKKSATVPTAVLFRPVVLKKSALLPKAALKEPVVLAESAPPPEAVLLEPPPLDGLGVRDDRAPVPIAVFP